MTETRIPPPLLAAMLAAAMWFLGADAPLPTWRAGLAVGLFLAAGLFGFPALSAFRRAGTTIDPVHIDRASRLVTGGVYRFTRNPMYVALVVLLLAWAAWLGGPYTLAGPALLVLWLDRLQIRAEERAMAARFGAEFEAYRRSVRRWL